MFRDWIKCRGYMAIVRAIVFGGVYFVLLFLGMCAAYLSRWAIFLIAPALVAALILGGWWVIRETS